MKPPMEGEPYGMRREEAGAAERCAAPAMADGRCRIHGGASSGAPLVHGRYSLVHRASLAEKHARFLDDPEPGDLSHEVALTRAFLEDYLERLGELQALRAEDIQFMSAIIRDISRMVERIVRIHNTTALTQAEVHYLAVRMADVPVTFIDDPERRAAALDALGQAVGVAPEPLPGGRHRPLRTVEEQ